MNTTEFDLLLQWFGNGLLDKSAAVDLGLFSQQFWALGASPSATLQVTFSVLGHIGLPVLPALLLRS